MTMVFSKKAGGLRVFCQHDPDGFSVAMQVIENNVAAHKGTKEELITWLDSVRAGIDELQSKVEEFDPEEVDEEEDEEEEDYDDEDEEE